jgi:hypothetical protein
MSVSFYVEIVPSALNWAGFCACGEFQDSTIFASHEEAVTAVFVEKSIVLNCGDEYCAAHLPSVRVVNDDDDAVTEFNVSNSNAAAILDVLGIYANDEQEDRLCGSLDATAFMGRVLIAQAISPVDAGIPTTTSGMMTDFGRPEGYLDAKLIELESIARIAMDRGLSVVWA